MKVMGSHGVKTVWKRSKGLNKNESYRSTGLGYAHFILVFCNIEVMLRNYCFPATKHLMSFSTKITSWKKGRFCIHTQINLVLVGSSAWFWGVGRWPSKKEVIAAPSANTYLTQRRSLDISGFRYLDVSGILLPQSRLQLSFNNSSPVPFMPLTDTSFVETETGDNWE